MTWNSALLSQYRVIRRNGQVTPFDGHKIAAAMTKAFLAVEGDTAKNSTRIQNAVATHTRQVINNISRRLTERGMVHIEDIQDQVELALMRAGEHKVARAYVLYREQHAQQRAQQPNKPQMHITKTSGELVALDQDRLRAVVLEACLGLAYVDANLIVEDCLKNLFDGIPEADVNRALVMSSRTLVEKEPNYSYVTARLLLDHLRQEALSFLDFPAKTATAAEMSSYYARYLPLYLEAGIKHELLNPKLREYNLDILGAALKPERDFQFTYLGLQTLYDRYFLHWDEVRFELPQAFFMRVAMGLALNEENKEQRAIEFYNLLSSFDFMSSTPTLFNSGSLRSQLSSCFLTTVPDDLEGIYGAIKDNAMLQKWAGGIGNDWSNVRGMGSLIKGTNGKSQGVVPFLKVANDTLVAVNQGGRRRGSGCAYLESWHIDIEEFLELRKNTGDERRRTHDMNTANWIPDLFMQRVHENGPWTLFSPNETPDLHDLYGEAFRTAYESYEQLAETGKIRVWKRVAAVELWRKMLSMLFETGHPWITFKDVCNLRSPQQHVGVVHSSNLCTEICLNTKSYPDPIKNQQEGEIAVCNLASINLANHIQDGKLDIEKLQRTIRTGMRMLDNVVELNYYAVPQSRNANLQHRPVGMGIMGFQDALYQLQIPYASQAAVDFADQSMEVVSYYAIHASTELAAERGRYKSFEGSLWSKGILPVDSIQFVAKSRPSQYLEIDTRSTLDWDALRQRVTQIGMRNSNCMAIAPTATISNIVGVSQSIEPTYQNLFVKSNLSGEFTVINPYLINELRQRGLWDEAMVNDLKYFDGSLRYIERIPQDLQDLYATAFEIDPAWLIEAAARRQKWIDQSQSLNLYMLEPSGRKLDSLYKLAWLRGLKTTYYLRSMGATHVEKSTIRDRKLNAVSNEPAPQVCSIDNPDCESCQ
ncbi:MAG: ribonucleoside-diphosphate reductase subunit alpha [Thiotrichaceae bacterium]|nr:ribonucleoside-diphosphate reductase subunit alpha [Thiotrichaceae bacterium]